MMPALMQARPTRIAEGFPKQRMVVLPRPVVAEALDKPITAELIATDVGVFPSAAGHYRDRPGGAPQAIVIYCVRGAGWAEIAGIRHPIRPDDILVIPAGVPHTYGAAEQRPWTIYWCHVAGRNVPYMLSLLHVRPTAPVIRAEDARMLVPMFEQMLATLENGYTQTSLVIASLIFGHLLGTILASRPRGGARVAGLDERVEQTIGFMQQSISGPINVSELAAVAKLSPSHYAVVFKRKTGYSVMNYFTRLKMQEACRLLDTTDMPIKEIANLLGYEDPLYFSRTFRKVMVMPAREYREQHKG